MDNIDFFKKTFELESIIKIGEEITKELEIVSNTLRKNFNDLESFIEDEGYKSKILNKDLLRYLSKTIKSSERNIDKFERELEAISNYNSNEDILIIDSEFLDKLNIMNKMNIYLRFELEEYLLNLEVVKGIVEDITNNLNKQKTDRLLGSKMLM